MREMNEYQQPGRGRDVVEHLLANLEAVAVLSDAAVPSSGRCCEATATAVRGERRAANAAFGPPARVVPIR